MRSLTITKPSENERMHRLYCLFQRAFRPLYDIIVWLTRGTVTHFWLIMADLPARL